ncbi:MAG: hypothetical protein ACYTKD_23200 [Planctomycetota bacterium]|jgi:hypothetical protein
MGFLGRFMDKRRRRKSILTLERSIQANRLRFVRSEAGAAGVRHLQDEIGRALPERAEALATGDAQAVCDIIDSLDGPSRTFVSHLVHLPPVGVAVSLQNGREGNARLWCYIVYPWEWQSWPGFAAARVNEGADTDPPLRDVPVQYAQVLSVFDQVVLHPFGLHAGFIGPRHGIGLRGFEGELSLVAEWRESSHAEEELGPGEPDLLADRPLSDFLPVLCDGMGNTYLTEKGREEHTLFFFDHELCTLKNTRKTLECLLDTFWKKPDEFL